MILSMKTEYALRALYEISESSGEDNLQSVVPRKEISLKQDIPAPYLEQILISLKKAGLIQSSKGPGGGYTLAKAPEKITVWDIYTAVDQPRIDGERCFPGLKSECSRLSICKIKNVWTNVNTALRESMQKMNLQNISA